MRRICLTVVGLYFGLLHAFSQFHPVVRTEEYSTHPLKLDQVNLVSSYYWQNGDHSAITGGIGTEKGSDLSNGIEVKWVGFDVDSVKNSLTAGLGIDYHTSASQAYVSKTGASKSWGTRIYPQLSWTSENLRKGNSFEVGAYYSGEFNYHSIGLDAGYSQKNSHNGEYSVKITGYYDRVKEIYPSELRPGTVSTVTSASGGGGSSSIPSDPRVTLTGSFSYSQIINQRLQGSVMADVVYQGGQLGLPFHRVYFQDSTDAVEALPANRVKFPVGLRLNYFMGDRIVVRSYYRFYYDTWGILSHTASIEIPFKINPFFSIAPFYRYYTQTAARYFAPYAVHKLTDGYYTSNYELSAFTAQSLGLNVRMVFIKGLLGTGIDELEARYSHYKQTTGLVSDVISINLGFK